MTCESWANIPLNESFATYAEYLWKAHKYGADEADYQRYMELDAYLGEAVQKKEDLIRFDYESDDEMFDNHSYAKGGLILHALRSYIGDEAFFKALEYYLKTYEFGKVEVHQLRLAFEHVTGEDLNWFFNQWFLAAGHPKLRIEDAYDTSTETYTLKIWQEQNSELYPVFKLPLNLDLWENGRMIQYTIEVDEPYQEFVFEDVQQPDLILVDSDFVLIGEMTHIKTPQQYYFQYHNYNDNVRARIDALEYFLDTPTDSISHNVLSNALKDPFWVVREEALFAFESDSSDFFDIHEELIVELASQDPNSLVRAGAIAVLASNQKENYIDIFKAGLSDSSYSVVGNALYAYLQCDVSDEAEILEEFKIEKNFNISSVLADFIIRKQDYTYYDWFSKNLKHHSGEDLWYFIKLFGMYLVGAPEDQVSEGIKELEIIAKNHKQYINRISAYQSLELFADYEEVPEILSQIKDNEKDERVLKYLNQ